MHLRPCCAGLAASVFVLVGVSIVIFTIARVIPGDPARIALGPPATPESGRGAAPAAVPRPALVGPVLAVRDRRCCAAISGRRSTPAGRSTPTSRQFLPATLELVLVASLLMVVVGIPLGVAGGAFPRPLAGSRRRASSRCSAWSRRASSGPSSSSWCSLRPRPDAGHRPPQRRRHPRRRASPACSRRRAARRRLARASRTPRGTSRCRASRWRCRASARRRGSRAATSAQSYGRDYIGLARAYGFTSGEIAWKYALRPAMIPTLTILGLDFAAKLGNAFLVEAVFAWPGHGALRRQRDPQQGPQRHRRHGAGHRLGFV